MKNNDFYYWNDEWNINNINQNNYAEISNKCRCRY